MEIASQLGVSFLLDGSVRRAGDLVRITADFIDGATGFSRWSQTFDRNLRDIFAVQSEIAGTVAQALAANVRGARSRQRRGRRRHAATCAAYDEYLRGRALYDLARRRRRRARGAGAIRRGHRARSEVRRRRMRRAHAR